MPEIGRKDRVQTPTLLQMETAECGAVALAIVLAYHGRHVPIETLRNECGINRDGSKASHLIHVARSYGLRAKGYRREPAQLQQMHLPLIAFWRFNHFLVIEGFGNHCVYLNDPASGRRTITAQEFDTDFTGVVLEFIPSPTFTRSENKPSLLNRLGQRLWTHWRTLLGLGVFGLVLLPLQVAMPVLLQLFIDQYWLAQQTDGLFLLLIGMLLAAVLRMGFTWGQTQGLNRFQTHLNVTWSGQFLWHVLRLPLHFYRQRSAGDILQRVALNQRLAALLAGETLAGVLALFMAVAYALVMLTFDTLIALLTFGVVLLNGALLHWLTRRHTECSPPTALAQSRWQGNALNGLYSIESIKAAGHEAHFFTRWSSLHATVLNAQQQWRNSILLLSTLPSLLYVLLSIGILLVGGLSMMDGTLTLGALVAVQSLAMSLSGAIHRVFDTLGNVQALSGDVQRLDDVLTHATDPLLTETPSQSDTPLSGAIELRQVSFKFGALAPPILHNLNARLTAGQHIALVGMSGSGKSTLAHLLAGLYLPDHGEIFFDGRRRADISRAAFNKAVALVDQDGGIFAGSIRDNLILWQSDITEADMIQAARDACLHEWIESRTGGYDHVLLENGSNLSGGEWQRLEIARALTRNPTILILDEATRMLDITTEQRIYAHLRRRGCTCFILSHRLSTLRDCDEIWVLEAGKIVQRGHHTSLLAQEGAYQRLMADAQHHAIAQDAIETPTLLELPSESEASALEIDSPHRFTSPSELQHVWAACQILGQHNGLTFNAPLENTTHPLAHIAADVPQRQVRLEENWWQQDSGDLLAFNRIDHRPYALLRHYGKYVAHDPQHQTTHAVNAAFAALLKPKALMFYRPLPSHPVGLVDLLRFALRGQSVAAAILIVISVLTAGLGLLMPWAMGHLIENLLPTGNQRQLLFLALGLSSIAIGTWLLGLYQHFVSQRMGVWMDVATHSAAWDRLLKLPAGFFRHYSAGDLAARINGIAAIRQRLSGAMLTGLLHGLFVVFTVMLMAAYSVPLTLLAVGMVSVAVAITLAGGMRIVKYEREVSEQAGHLSGLLLQWLNGITKLRSSGTENRAFAQWHTAFTRQQTCALQAATWRNSLQSVMGLLTLLSLVAIVAAVSVWGWATHLTTSQFFVFNAAFAVLTGSMLSLTYVGLGLLSVIPWYERAQTILHASLERRGGLSVKLDGSIDIERVYFAYQADQSPIVRDLTVHIDPGEWVAIVGASGCGKTTLLRLLLGFEQPTSGCIRYNGYDLTTIDVAELRRQLGVVLQNGQLVEGDIGSSIISGRPLTIADAWQAAHLSAVASDIAALPMGMDTILHDRAVTLSGGQRQRLLLARALAHRPRILLLDEATSSLDHFTQAQIMRHLRQLRVTTLFIAHRLSTLVDVDRILVLEQGVIVEQGSYSELLAKKGVFAQLVDKSC
ncbi:hypothetical protein TPSD3_02315 [Thioflexithrix psekupsensis]|uniref:NHLP family bacteriocin export ABC transporter peptidase/permease/ATPase subunit n=2 Tax=Thioflexithrix psekupsensis TaxID=1570016 RepID=A0A251XAC3_9GAMM|nr:hypothetical protein TPSD3_02315 [Thioflexithrix psekupsensis]